MAHPGGEIATSKATAVLNVPMGLSNYSTKSLEDVIAHSSGNPYVMQMSLLKNKGVMIKLLERAEAAGFKAALVTLDVPWLGHSSLQWEDIMPFCRKHTKMEIWGKGIYGIKDAEKAIACGFDGILISNHGTRQLDSVPASLDVLREVAPITRGQITVAVDGGIRRGTDIFKALALGADFCFAGRPAIWSLAYNGQKGVELGLNLLYDEFTTAMALAGCRNVSEITSDFISVLRPGGILAKL
ncbi:FMN-dependent dehydrogenase [Penicillium sp. IBT 16267x]|nr:FMN-dependent dehydrogenase [Penicillium sp. IBT 16267x]